MEARSKWGWSCGAGDVVCCRSLSGYSEMAGTFVHQIAHSWLPNRAATRRRAIWLVGTDVKGDGRPL